MEIVIITAAAAAGYLSGSVSYATIITRLVRGTEIRVLGSGNPGALNVGAAIGRRWGLVVGLLDGLKSFLPMLAAGMLLGSGKGRFADIAVMTAGLSAVVGHWKPIFHGFKGGQCIGTAVGVFLYIVPLEFFVSFITGGVFVFLVLKKRVGKWVRWVPIFFILLIPPAAILGGRQAHRSAGVILICGLLLFINRFYIRDRIRELQASKTSNPGNRPSRETG